MRRKIKAEIREGKKGKMLWNGKNRNGRRLEGNGKNRKWVVN